MPTLTAAIKARSERDARKQLPISLRQIGLDWRNPFRVRGRAFFRSTSGSEEFVAFLYGQTSSRLRNATDVLF